MERFFSPCSFKTVTFLLVAFLEKNPAKDIYKNDYSTHHYQIIYFRLKANAKFVYQDSFSSNANHAKPLCATLLSTQVHKVWGARTGFISQIDCSGITVVYILYLQVSSWQIYLAVYIILTLSTSSCNMVTVQEWATGLGQCWH